MTTESDFDRWLGGFISKGGVQWLRNEVVWQPGDRGISWYELVQAWYQSVQKFENDRMLPDDDRTTWGAYDLCGALHQRDVLATRTRDLDPTLRDNLSAAVSEVDRRYVDLTENDNELHLILLDGVVSEPFGWWWRRIPRDGPVRRELSIEADS